LMLQVMVFAATLGLRLLVLFEARVENGDAMTPAGTCDGARAANG
jgi:hypothetical protein